VTGRPSGRVPPTGVLGQPATVLAERAGFMSHGGRIVADVRQQVALSNMTEFENFSVFKPGDHNLPALTTMLDQLVAWSSALAPLRDRAGAAA
jgi:hypothetical protein